MDIQRIVLFAGLAIVSYLMVLAWNEDYNQPRTEQVSQVATTGSNGSPDDMILPENSTPTDDEFVTPETGELRATSSDGEQSVSDQFITVVTDVLELTIDRVGGNVIASSLLQYDESLDSEQSLTL